jgi:hypothetical protein
MPSVGSVLRYQRDVGESSNVGVLATDREGDGYYNRVAGIDATLSLTSKDRVQVQVLGSETLYPRDVASDFGQPDGAFDGTAIDVFYFHNTSSLDWYACYQDLSPGFRADIGFVTQVGYRFADVGWGHTWNRDAGHWYTMLNVGSGYEREEDYNGTVLKNGPTLWFNYRGPRRTSFNLAGFSGQKSYAGQDFDITAVDFNGGTWLTSSLELYLHGAVGDHIDYAHVRPASRLRLGPSLTWNVDRHLSLSFDHVWEELEVDGGRLYTANLSQLRVAYHFSRRMSVRTILQLADVRSNSHLYAKSVEPKSQNLYTQVLGSYQVNPQTVVFIGYSDASIGNEQFSLTQTDRTVFVKLGYAWSL